MYGPKDFFLDPRQRIQVLYPLSDKASQDLASAIVYIPERNEKPAYSEQHLDRVGKPEQPEEPSSLHQETQLPKRDDPEREKTNGSKKEQTLISRRGGTRKMQTYI